jgi:hypothetical protein
MKGLNDRDYADQEHAAFEEEWVKRGGPPAQG